MNGTKGFYGVAIVACLTAVVCAPRAARSQTSPEEGWAAMTRCAAIADDAARHKCSDDVLRRAGLLETRKGFGLQTSPVRPAAAPSAAPAPAAPAAPPVNTAGSTPTDLKHPSEDQLQVTLGAVTRGGDGKLVLTTSEGAVWRQVESTAVRPTPVQGQTMTIERTSFGGFMCKPGKWVAFRCYRAR